jgi:hypothetical protein
MDEIDDDERAELAALGQKIVIWSIVLNFVVGSIQRTQVMPPLAVAALSFAVAAWSLFGVVRICSALGKRRRSKLLYMVLSFVPLVNIVSLVVLNRGANRLLRAAGWRIGLFGARP